MLERLINSFNNLFSLSIDTSSPETINASANQLEANRQTVQQATSTINTVSDAISMVMPLSSVAEVAANADTGNTGAAWAAVPFAILDVATMGEGNFAIKGARMAAKGGNANTKTVRFRFYR